MSDNLFEIAALAYATRGWAVFPCKPGTKEPVTPNGFKDASTDPAQIRRWWARWPLANPAIATGAASGVWALDPDSHDGKDGLVTLAGLERQHGALPRTATQRTGSGGEHRLFRMNGIDVRNSAGRLGPGVDVRGNGGYIVLPPSVHPCGGIYAWIEACHPADVEPADAPDWLYGLLNETKQAGGATSNSGPPIRDAYVRAAVDGELGRVLSAAEGTRNDTLNRAAFALGQFAGAGALDRADAETRLLKAARAVGLGDAEAAGTISSGFNAGEQQPRQPTGARTWSTETGAQEQAERGAGEEPPGDVRQFPVMADEAFIGLPGDIVRMVAPHTESDPAGLLLSTLTMFGNCLGRGPHYRVEASEHGPNLFVLKVGDSSKARKGTGEDRVLAFFRQVDEEWTRQRVHTGLSSGEGVLWEIRNPITKLSKDKTSGARVEEIVDAGIDDKRLMVIESEFAGTLRVMQREGNILSRILRDAWDRGNLATLTKNSPARATSALISIIGHITAPELRTYFDRTEMANGFGNRFLFACVRRSQFLPFGGSLHDGDVSAMAYWIRRAVHVARHIGRVTMSPATAEAWQEIYADLSADRPGLLGSLTARSEAQVVRIAMLYALYAGSAMIEVEHLMAAVAIEQFCRDSVEYIFADMLGDPVADTILDALRSAGTDGLTRTEISNLFSRNTSANQIARALGELARRRLATQRRADSSGQGGRPPEIWVAVIGGMR